MRLPTIRAIGGFLLMMVIGRGQASPPDRVIEPVGEAQDTARFSFRVHLPTLHIDRTPDGTAGVAVSGFARLRSAPGSPELPATVVRVAIPSGAVPILSVRSGDEDIYRGVVPRPVSSRVQDEHGVSEIRVRDSARYDSPGVWPAQVAWLGEVGAFRDQPYVDVWVSPVRYDPSIRGLRAARTIDVTVEFEGGSVRPAPVSADPDFEDLYRRAFANYSQSLLFRRA